MLIATCCVSSLKTIKQAVLKALVLPIMACAVPDKPCTCHVLQQGLSTDDGGCSRSSPASKSKHHFRIFFPLPPYDGLQFNALRSGTGFNFTVSCSILLD